MPHVLVAPDKFKGTASAAAIASAMAAGAEEASWSATKLPLSDGGEGLLAVVGGPNRESVVTGPLSSPVMAAWRLDYPPPGGAGAPTAVIESAEAVGLTLAGGAGGNDPLAATTRGVGELVLAATGEGARRVVVGCGGSATTDGGAGALEVLGRPALEGVELVVACDVTIGFLEAARRFAPQKGASPEQVVLLEERLSQLAGRYAAELGVDVRQLEGAGAAGGLAGGLAAIGGRLVPGFSFVASLLGLEEHLRSADAVVTGEGTLDAQSFLGKVVGGVSERARHLPRLCLAGRATAAGARTAAREGMVVVSLSDRFGQAEAMARPLELVGVVVAEWLEGLRS